MSTTAPSEETASQLPHSSTTDKNLLCLLDSPEDFEAYLADVRRRREAHQAQRRSFWLSAVEQLDQELRAAEEEQAAKIADELRAVIRTFQNALDKDVLAGDPPDAADLPASDTAKIDTPLPSSSSSENLVPLSVPAAANGSTLPPPQDQTQRNGTHAAAAVPPPSELAAVAEAAQRLLEEEARQALAAKAEDLEDRIGAHLDAGGSALADAIRARALFCEGQSLIYGPHAPKQGRQPLLGLLDDLAAGTPWAGRQAGGGAMISPQAWALLADLYHGAVVAGEAMAWYEENEHHLAESSRVELLNAISAAQQRIYRRPESIVRRDDTVQELYRRVRESGARTAFIRALSPHVGDEELPALAGRCAQLWQDLRAEVEETRSQAERAAQKEAAVNAVLAWEASLEGRGITSESLETDRQMLCALLDECLAAGVPTSTVKVRAAILDTAPVLLEGQPKYVKFLEAVTIERVKRSLAAVEVAPPEVEVRDEELGRLVEAVVPFVRGKKMVMLGGKSRPQVAQELGGLLECAVTWLDSDRGDKFNKFGSAVKKSDIVLMLKNFASHEFFYGSRDAMAAGDKHFVVIPSGYSVKQVLFQLGEYVARERGTVTSAAQPIMTARA